MSLNPNQVSIYSDEQPDMKILSTLSKLFLFKSYLLLKHL